MTTNGSDPERTQLREKLELAFQQLCLAETRIRGLAGRAGIEPEVIELADPPWQGSPAADEGSRRGADVPRDDVPEDAVPDHADEASWWTADRAARPPPLTPRPGWACSTLAGQPVRIVGISVRGFDGPRLRRVVAMIAGQQQRGRSFVPVFLTDSPDAAVFEEYGYAYEYLPGDDRRHAFPWIPDWGAYLARRRRMVERKWNLAEVIVFGTSEFGR
ncbi:MAG TPA: hypothetical protein VK943_06755 [Arenibaculum sp.]|nr:hypothetical protein [Arenibaculum sp.]